MVDTAAQEQVVKARQEEDTLIPHLEVTAATVRFRDRKQDDQCIDPVPLPKRITTVGRFRLETLEWISIVADHAITPPVPVGQWRETEIMMITDRAVVRIDVWLICSLSRRGESEFPTCTGADNRSINTGFQNLRNAIPFSIATDSKAVVLRKATAHIQHLEFLLRRAGVPYVPPPDGWDGMGTPGTLGPDGYRGPIKRERDSDDD